MIVIHENVALNIAIKPMECPRCGYQRNFDVPEGTCVRKSKRGKPPPILQTDIVLLKCRKCGHAVGISSERG